MPQDNGRVQERSPLMLVHGFTDTGRTWAPLISLLEARHELLAPTLVGHRGGDALPDPLGRAMDAMVTGLERVLDAAGHQTAHLVGNSLGGWLSFELAARGRARSVVALSPAGGWEGDAVPPAVARFFARTHRVAPLGARLAERIAARPRLRRLALRDVVAHGERIPPATAVELIRGPSECAIYEPLALAARNGDFRSELADIDVPVRIVWGAKDRILPQARCSAYFRSMLPDAEWIELPGCGHLPHHDDPQRVARVVLEVTSPS